jgi:DNA-binding response OmpR family regulator
LDLAFAVILEYPMGLYSSECMRTLIVEDAPRMRRWLSQALKGAGYAVDTAADGVDGLALAELNDYDVVLLDLMLPRMDGLSVLKRLRQDSRDVPVIVLSAKDTLEDRVNGLKLGADDYLVKPFALAELLARLQALVRRRYGAISAILQIADLVIDTGRCTVTKKGRILGLRPREYALLEYLAIRKGHVVSRTDIEHHIYDEHADLVSNAVDAAICRLRRKIDTPDRPSLVQTRRSMGYIMDEVKP